MNLLPYNYLEWKSQRNRSVWLLEILAWISTVVGHYFAFYQKLPLNSKIGWELKTTLGLQWDLSIVNLIPEFQINWNNLRLLIFSVNSGKYFAYFHSCCLLSSLQFSFVSNHHAIVHFCISWIHKARDCFTVNLRSMLNYAELALQ